MWKLDQSVISTTSIQDDVKCIVRIGLLVLLEVSRFSISVFLFSFSLQVFIERFGGSRQYWGGSQGRLRLPYNGFPMLLFAKYQYIPTYPSVSRRPLECVPRFALGMRRLIFHAEDLNRYWIWSSTQDVERNENGVLRNILAGYFPIKQRRVTVVCLARVSSWGTDITMLINHWCWFFHPLAEVDHLFIHLFCPC